MKCSMCRGEDLVPMMTSQGVEIDYCHKCRGIWLDKGEIFYFTRTPVLLKMKLERALKNTRPSKRVNPHTGKTLVEVDLIPKELVIDYCPETGGIWLDWGELEKLPSAKEAGFKISMDRNVNKPSGQTAESLKVSGYMPLPNLAFISGVTLFLLYGLLTLIIIILANYRIISAGAGLIIGVIFVIVQFLISPFFMDLSLRWFYKVSWVSPNELPADLREVINRLCGKNNMKFPRIGIIPDGAPNAFTYGHTPNNARIVVTRGIMNLLEPGTN